MFLVPMVSSRCFLHKNFILTNTFHVGLIFDTFKLCLVFAGKIKRICETELGIVSQCCQPRQAQKLNKQYFENVALKINVKVCVLSFRVGVIFVILFNYLF